MALPPGTRIGPYEIVTLLGTGGMGEVYRATDRRLGRDVAVKVLPEAKHASPEHTARFEREARLLASINHPNIATIHGLEDLVGSSAIVMELVDGPSLADLIARGPVGIAESARIAIQIADGMSTAHSRGIVHRDLKPLNVRIAPDGRVKILDLGLAKMVAPDSDATSDPAVRGDTETLAAETHEGTILGTAAYMSPEQAVGARIDARTDVWAFGVVLFEMLSGRRAFPGRTIPDTLAAVLRGTVDWEGLPADVPRELRLLIERCLVPEVSGRLGDLGGARDVLQPFADPGFVTARHASAETKSIVVLPFANSSPDPDNEYFSDGLTEEVITDLSRIGALRVISRTTAMRLKGTGKDLATLTRELNVRYALEGSVRKAGNALRITAQLVDTSRDETLWSDKYSGTLDDVFAFQEQVSRAIVEALRLRLSETEDRRLAAASRPNTFVYDTYLRTRRDIWSFVPERLERARVELERALSVVGPNSVLHSALGLLEWQYVNGGISADPRHLEAARRHAEEVRRLDPSSAHGPRLLGLIAAQSGDAEGLVRNLRRAVELDPHDPDSTVWLAFGWIFSGHARHARPLLERQLVVDPLHNYLMFGCGFDAYFSGDWERAVQWYEKGAVLAPDHPGVGMVLAQTHASAGDLDRMSAAVERHAPEPRSHPLATLTHILRHAMLGEAAAADALTDDAWAAKIWSDFQYTHVMAQAQAKLGRRSEALRWLERSTERGLLNAPFLSERDPLLAGLRDDPRFADLMTHVRRRWERFEAAVA